MLPATRYVTVVASYDSPQTIENGLPILVHGVLFQCTAIENTDIIFLERDGTTMIYRTYADNNFGDLPTYHEHAPFLAFNGLVIKATAPLSFPSGPISSSATVTIFYSQIGD